jgi:hypothetical protein
MNPRGLHVTTVPMTLFNPARISAESTRLVRARYQIPQGALVMGFVGRIVRDKGLIELTQSWRVLGEGCPPLHLLVVGPFESQGPDPGRRGSDAAQRSAHPSGRNGARHAEHLSHAGPSRPTDVSRRLRHIAAGGGGNGTARDRDPDPGMRRCGSRRRDRPAGPGARRRGTDGRDSDVFRRPETAASARRQWPAPRAARF